MNPDRNTNGASDPLDDYRAIEHRTTPIKPKPPEPPDGQSESGSEAAPTLAGNQGGTNWTSHSTRSDSMSQSPTCDQDTPEGWWPFPTDALPGPVRELVESGAASIGCDAAMIGPLALAAMASAIGNSRVVQLHEGWTEPSVLWACVVAPSGTGKSPVLDLVTSPISERDHALHAKWQAEYERFRASRSRAKTKRNEEKPTALDPEPKCERVVTNDPTYEAIGSMMESSPRGMLLACDELAAWFGSFARYKAPARAGSEEARWLPMHRAGPILSDRKDVEKSVRVKLAALSIAGLIQPGVLARALGPSDFDSGLVARLLLSMPPIPRKRWRFGRGRPKDIEANYRLLIDRLLELKMATSDEGSVEPAVVRLDAEAEAVWADYFNELNDDIQGRSERERAALSKLEGGAARLALVVHLGRCAAGEASDEQLIDAESMRRGIELAKWFRREAERVYAMLGGEGNTKDDADRNRCELIAFIQKNDGQVTVRETQRKGPYRLRKCNLLARAALQELEDRGDGSWEPPTGGRTRVFRLNSCDTSTPNASPAGDTSGPDAPKNAGSVATVAGVAGVRNNRDDWGEV